jgi:quercetin dioxygenase-like cupin family protein
MPYAPSMTAGSVTLASAQFFGNQFHTVQTDSFVCAEGEATGSAREVPRHTHAGSHFVLVVRGTYITEARNQDRWYGPGTLIYNPIGTTHRDRFHKGCGRFLAITPSAVIAHLLDARIPVSLVMGMRSIYSVATCATLRRGRPKRTSTNGSRWRERSQPEFPERSSACPMLPAPFHG